MKWRRIAGYVAALASLAWLLAVPASAQAAPASYHIDDVPYYTQLDSTGCGPACLAMVFDYWGPAVEYKEIVDVAQSNKGTSLPRMARAVHFSSSSYAKGWMYPGYEVNGYTTRELGYGGFYYASTTPWLDQLKEVVAKGYPVICLVNWIPNAYPSQHYDVVTGYDDATQTITVLDPFPWGPERDPYRSSDPFNMELTYSYDDFLNMWATAPSVAPDLMYAGVLVAPWKVKVEAPKVVHRNQQFRLRVTTTCPCIAPFGSSDFPQFAATDGCVRVKTAGGIRDVDGAGVVFVYGSDYTTLQPGETATVSLRLRAGKRLGKFTINARATGTIEGAVSEMGYNYADRVGSTASVRVKVIR